MDPTLAFVMGAAPTRWRWPVVRRRSRPWMATAFHLPATMPVDTRLVGGAALFGVGWGLAGLCPGPALAALAIHPEPALVLCLGMAAGFALHRLTGAPRVADGDSTRGLSGSPSTAPPSAGG